MQGYGTSGPFSSTIGGMFAFCCLTAFMTLCSKFTFRSATGTFTWTENKHKSTFYVKNVANLPGDILKLFLASARRDVRQILMNYFRNR